MNHAKVDHYTRIGNCLACSHEEELRIIRDLK